MEARKGIHPISSKTKVRKIHDDLPDYINKEYLEQDSLLTIDSEYDPEGGIQL